MPRLAVRPRNCFGKVLPNSPRVTHPHPIQDSVQHVDESFLLLSRQGYQHHRVKFKTATFFHIAPCLRDCPTMYQAAASVNLEQLSRRALANHARCEVLAESPPGRECVSYYDTSRFSERVFVLDST
jgi:hypothetical protein